MKSVYRLEPEQMVNIKMNWKLNTKILKEILKNTEQSYITIGTGLPQDTIIYTFRQQNVLKIVSEAFVRGVQNDVGNQNRNWTQHLVSRSYWVPTHAMQNALKQAKVPSS